VAHLLDEVPVALGPFDVFEPRNVKAKGLCLAFHAPLFEPRRAQIADAITRVTGHQDAAVGLTFWEPQHARFLSLPEALAFLAQHGVGVAESWDVRVLVSDEPETPICHFASQDVPMSLQAVHALSEMVVRLDHGTWEGLSMGLYLWNRRAEVLARFWDDRGADVLCRDAMGRAVCAQRLLEHVDQALTALVWKP
jgi:hypothetical protein